jgi:hypothetical protein
MTRRLPLLVVLAALSGCYATERRSPSEVRSSEISHEESDPVVLHSRLASMYLTYVDYPGSPDGQRLKDAERALEHADAVIALDDERAEGHFYRAVAIGRILELSTLPNPGRIGDLEAAGKRARELDPDLEGAGPERLLAMLYWKAPAWPIGPEDAGDDDVIDALFREAITRAPGCCENHVSYAEYLEDKDRLPEALEHARQAQDLLGRDPLVTPFDRRDLERRIRDLLRR